MLLKKRILLCPDEGFGLSADEAERRSESGLSYEHLMDVYINEIQDRAWRPEIVHLFCFKASGGVDSQMPRLSMIHLFNAFSKMANECYSSNRGTNVLATAQMMKYDGDLTQEVHRFYDSNMMEISKTLFEGIDLKSIHKRMEIIGIYSTLRDNWA